jgi:hypothetical protein
MLGVPGIFTMDLMHLSVLNDPDLLLQLWRGTIKRYLPDDISTWDWAILKDKKNCRLMAILSRCQLTLFLHHLDVHLAIWLKRSILGTRLGNFNRISTDLGLYYCDTSFHNPTGKTTANWLLGFKYFSIPLLLHKTFEMVTQPSRTLSGSLRHFTTNA